MKFFIMLLFLSVGTFISRSEEINNPGIGSEIITVNINAESAQEAVYQMIEQNSNKLPSIKQIHIHVDNSIRKMPVNLCIQNASVISVLKRIAEATASRLTLDVSSFGYNLTPVKILDDARFKRYRISDDLIRKLNIKNISNQKLGEQLFKLGIIPVSLNFDTRSGILAFEGSQLEIQKLELLLYSASLMNLNIER